MPHPVPQERRRDNQFSPEKVWQYAVGDHAPQHSYESYFNSRGHTDLLRRVGAGELERHPRLKTAVLELLFGEIARFVSLQTFYSETAGDHRFYEHVKQAKSVVLGLQQVALRPLGVLVGGIGHVLVAPECLWRQPFRQVAQIQLERELDFVMSR